MNHKPFRGRRTCAAGRALLFTASATLLWTSRGFALGEFAGGLVRINTFAEVTADSNSFGNASEESDVIYTLRPQLTYDREGSRGSAHFDVGYAINRFADNSGLNSEDISVNGSIELVPGGGRLTGSLNLAYFDGSRADEYIGARVDIRRLNFGVDADYALGGRTSLRFGADVNRYRTDVRPDADSWSLRAGAGFRFRPTLSAFLDYAHGDTENSAPDGTGIVSDYSTDNISVGLNGTFTPRLSGTVSVGYDTYNARSQDTLGDGNSVVSRVSLTWEARQNTQVRLSGGRSNRITSSAQSFDTVSATISVDQKLGPRLGAEASLLWENFETREIALVDDDRIAANLALRYTPNDRLGFSATVTHSDRNSDNPLLDISRTTLTLSARFTF